MNHFTRTTALLRRGATTAAAVLLAALPVQAAHAAQAAQAAQDSHPRPRHTADQSDWLYVTVSHGDDARTGDSRGALLRCEPPQGQPQRRPRPCDQIRSATATSASSRTRRCSAR
ncbi:SSI family serine proteinase inhibitor [Streptomyces sp. e14]|uniref:SSI family serine proteinase inhibitor n=1 Tax=Streptomyces sp. e14 TaxID=645465 RepID=UPI0026A8F0B8